MSICFKMMQKDPKHRYPSMSAVAESLAAWCRGEAVTPPHAPGAAVESTADEQPTARLEDAPDPAPGAPANGSSAAVPAPSEPHGVHTQDTIAANQPPTVHGEADSAHAAGNAVTGDNGVLELGIEVAGDSSSLGTRMLLEERRARAVRRDRTIRWIWFAAVALFLLVVVAVAVHSTFFSTSATPTPTPAPSVESSRPTIVPRR